MVAARLWRHHLAHKTASPRGVVSWHLIKMAALGAVAVSVMVSFWIHRSALAYNAFVASHTFWSSRASQRAFTRRFFGGRCRSVVNLVQEPYSLGYQLRDQVIDLDGVQYAAYKWDGPIERQDFDAAARTLTLRARFKVVNSKLYVKAHSLEFWGQHEEQRYIKMVESLLMALHLYRIPDMDFWVELSDTMECNRPAFTYSLNTLCEKGGFAIPSYGAYTATLGHKQLEQLFKCFDKQHPYSDRIPKGVWRGSTTGSLITENTYMENRRVKLASLARNWTDIMDVGLHDNLQVGKDMKELLQGVAPLLPGMEMEYFNDYAFILDVDGYGWSDRMARMIGFNTPMLRQSSYFQEYFGHLLQVGVHMETFAENLADVVPRLQGLLQEYKDSPKRLRRMVETMYNFSQEHSSHLGLIRAVAYGLTVYASKLTWKTEMERGFVEVKTSACCIKNMSFPPKFLEAVRAG